MHLVYRPASSNVAVNGILSDQAHSLSPTAHTSTTAPASNTSTAGSSLGVNGMQNIAPWGEPPTTPPKSSRSFALPTKTSFSTFSTFRTGSSSTYPRPPRTSDSYSTLSTSEGQSQPRLSADDNSRRHLFNTVSSTVLETPSLHKSKSTFSFFPKLRGRSKSRSRANSNNEIHPSLQKPPPVPDAYVNKDFITPSITSPHEYHKKDKIKDKAQRKKKSSDARPPSPPLKHELDEYDKDALRNLDLSQWGVPELIKEGIIGAGGQPAPTYDTSQESSSFSSGFEPGSDHYRPLHFSGEFSDPFHPTSPAEKRHCRILSNRSSGISPKDQVLGKVVLHSSPTSKPSWTAPESWGVDIRDLDVNNDNESSADEDDRPVYLDPKVVGMDGRMEFAKSKEVDVDSHDLEPGDSNANTNLQMHHRKRTKKGVKKRVTPYIVRIYKDDDSFHEAKMFLTTTVAELVPSLNEKLFIPKHETYRLYVRERGRERLLGMTEKPANLIKRRLEHHGYDANDGIILLQGDKLSFLIRFIYRSSLFTPDKQVTINSFDNVDLEGRALVAIPIAVHKNAEKVISLKLSGNPMLEIPLDFVQSCTSLLDLRLSNMSMKTVPRSVPHLCNLRKLDLSSNRIGNLDQAFLDNSSLEYLYLQNNRIENLPWYFPRLHSLTVLNISNNKFRTVPSIVCQIKSLADLDISFNMISELPEEIGKLTQLKSLTIVGNHISQFPDECADLIHLRKLDCRRNVITNLCVVSMLPQLQYLSADHNAVQGLDLSLGPCLRTLDASHNEITQLSLLPGPVGRTPYALTSLDISYAKLSSLDRFALGHLSSLRHLRLDHNSFQSIPETLGDLKDLETFSCSDNKLNELPKSLGNLQRLTDLDAHNNSLTQLPLDLWYCGMLERINVTSNFLEMWHDPPVRELSSESADGSTSTLALHEEVHRKASTTSLVNANGSAAPSLYPPLVHSLKRLYLGENRLSDDALRRIMHLRELRVLNLSFNDLQDLPTRFFRGLTQLEELYLSGNKIANIPTEDLHRLERLTTLYLNGNRLVTLPQELQMLTALTSLDVGSNQLKYNTNNFEFDWNWNFNKTLKYLNLSGNKRLQIKVEKRQTYYGHGPPKHPNAPSSNLSSFTDLTQLRVLGLMDVTLPTVHNGTADTPEEMDDRRVRTSASTILKMSYGIADALGKNDTLNMLDLVQEIKAETQNVGAVFAMFGRSQPPRPGYPGAHANRLAKYLRDRFVGNFVHALNNMKHGDGVPDALRRSFLEMNRCLIQALRRPPRDPRKNSAGTVERDFRFSLPVDQATIESGASGIVVYFQEKENARTMYVANAGDSLAVVSSQGVAQLVAHRHDPFDRLETARIRTAEGWVSPSGLVNGMVDVSRSFGFYQCMPAVNARPDVSTYPLTLKDEFVIIADRSLWDFVSFQTAVDIARTERGDPMIAAQKLRDFAISYGAEGSTMIMVIGLAEAPEMEGPKKKTQILDRQLARLEGEVSAPTGHIALVFSDIRNSTHLWEVNPGMATAHRAHNALLRRLLRFCGGYEVKTEGDAFMCAFPTSLAAVWWCLRVQSELIEVAWPLEVLECEDGKPIYDTSGNLIARGLSVRMGIHCGYPSPEPDPITHRMDYFGTMVNRSSRICGNAAGGEIMCSAEILREIKASIYGETETEHTKSQPTQAIEEIRQMGLHIVDVGEVKLKGLEVPEAISRLYPSHLAGRQNCGPEGIAESGSRVPFSVEQMRELGLICLRLETLTTSRIFNVVPERKGSMQTLNLENEPSECSPSLKLFGDPNVLLPPMNAQSTDAELMALLDSLATRVVNAISALKKEYPFQSVSQFQTLTPRPSSSNKDRVVSALERRKELDERTLEHILSLLNSI